MKSIKKMFSILLLLALVGGGVMMAKDRGVLPNQAFELDEVKNSITDLPQTKELASFQKDVEDQTKTLTNRTGEVTGHVQQVLGEAVKVEDGEKSSTRALEYGKYLYCQQVIEEWEKEVEKD